MAVGAQDYIDRLLVKKYQKEKVDNHDSISESMVNPEKMLSAMQDYASISRSMFTLNNKLKAACSAINAASAQYRQSSFS